MFNKIVLVYFYIKFFKHFFKIMRLIYTQCTVNAIAKNLNVKNFLYFFKFLTLNIKAKLFLN